MDRLTGEDIPAEVATGEAIGIRTFIDETIRTRDLQPLR